MTNRLEEKLRSGDFAVTTELTPPKGIDLTDVFAKAELLKPCVDAVNLTESPRARMAIEPKSVGRLLIERGVEPIVQVTARDRNRIAVQADLLGISLSTVRAHLHTVYEKLHVQSRTEAVVKYLGRE